MYVDDMDLDTAKQMVRLLEHQIDAAIPGSRSKEQLVFDLEDVQGRIKELGH